MYLERTLSSIVRAHLLTFIPMSFVRAWRRKSDLRRTREAAGLCLECGAGPEAGGVLVCVPCTMNGIAAH
jgi:ABC-type spermidine/putrescine transport system permease subunit II